MKAKHLVFLALIFPVVVSAQPGSFRDPCPPGMVMGASDCVWKELCPDGRPLPVGGCLMPREVCADGRPAPPGGCGPTPEPCIGEQGRISDGCKGATGVTAPTVVVPVPRRCETIVVTAEKSNKNAAKVLFVNGDAEKLFARYYSELGQSGREIPLEKLIVVLVNKVGEELELRAGEEVKMSLSEFFRGVTWEQLWRKRLKGKISADIEGAELEARRIFADLVCGRTLNKTNATIRRPN